MTIKSRGKTIRAINVMADLRITCPHCNQAITCDDQWAGQQLQCPLCQGAFTMPGSPPASAGKHNPLVPKPPAGGGSKLSVGQAQVPAQAGRQIPIRNLSTAPQKKDNPLVKILVGVVIVAALGVGGYYGFGYVKGIQDKNNSKSRAELRNSDGGEAGHALALNRVLDATEPGGPGLGSLAPQSDRPRRNRAMAPPAPGAGMTADAASGTNSGPVVAPKYTLDISQAAIPESRVNGMISGTNFVAETARIDTLGTVHVLQLLQGQNNSPDSEVLVYLRLKPGEKLGGQTVTVSSDMKSGIPQVAKRWKTNPSYAPTLKPYNFGYAMKLELAAAAPDGSIPGKIYLSLPDTEQTVVAGTFKATVFQPQQTLQPAQYTAPVVATPPAGADRSAMDRRYGIRR
jgi:hypothetical protein